MKRNFTAQLVLVFVLGLIGISPSTFAEPLHLAPQEGVLLLASGNVLEGKITRVGDHYYVALEHGEIHVRTTEVEFFGRSLNDLYHRKRKSLISNSAEEHIQLAHWCVRHKLLNYAQQEYLRAHSLQPNHPRLPLLRRYIETTINPPRYTPRKPFVKQQATEETEDDLLQDVADAVPEEALQSFTKTIQPLLLNSCSTTECHGPGATNKLVLERFSGSRPKSPRTTLRNLQAALACVDRAAPAQSPLLVKPIGPHGGLKKPVIAQHDLDKYQLLIQWVGQVGPEKTVTPDQSQLPESLGKSAFPLLQQLETGFRPGKKRQKVSQRAEPPGPEPKEKKQPVEAAENRNVRKRPVRERKKPQFGLPVQPEKEKDPFDPAEFNRQYSLQPK